MFEIDFAAGAWTIALAAFLAGLFSAVHCIGMCGSIIAALTFQLDPALKRSPQRLLPFLLAYSAGRIVSYSLAGCLVGWVGVGLVQTISPDWGHNALVFVATLLMIGLGLYLAGWFPGFSSLERIGIPLWKRIEPFGRRFVPVRTLPHAFAFGLLWGWLPCGLVYSLLLLSLSAGSAGVGAVVMFSFGLGTLPAILGAGVAFQLTTAWVQRPIARKVAGLLVIGMAISLPFLPMHGHHNHGSAAHMEHHHQ